MPLRCIRLTACAVAAAALFSGTVACSPSTTGPDQTATSTSTTTGEQRPAGHGAYARCLEDNGVPAPPPGAPASAPPGVDQQTWDKAMQACDSLAPGPPGPPPGNP
ncbi:MAG: hypothetical protein JWR37_4968 [Mycobacterium sp.]|nr:hypothetical protein [Mycobacterium sp.]